MPIRTLPSRSLLAAAVLALPLTAGCGRKACFTWTAQEGTCPAQSEALEFFSDPRCPGRITSVESAPTSELDGELCCYAVTANEDVDEGGCAGFGGANSSGSFDESSVFAASGGFDGGGPIPPSCVSCGAALKVGVFASTPCNEATGTLVNDLLSCACNGNCSAPCGGDLCGGSAPGSECFVCLQDSTQGCAKELDACFADP
jgi:hypothetical protein